jgi:hypothetical protein
VKIQEHPLRTNDQAEATRVGREEGREWDRREGGRNQSDAKQNKTSRMVSPITGTNCMLVQDGPSSVSVLHDCEVNTVVHATVLGD